MVTKRQIPIRAYSRRGMPEKAGTWDLLLEVLFLPGASNVLSGNSDLHEFHQEYSLIWYHL